MDPSALAGDTLVISVIWQTTLCLLAGLVAAALLSNRPARAHTALLLGIVATVVTPVLTILFRSYGWGLLSPLASVVIGTSD